MASAAVPDVLRFPLSPSASPSHWRRLFPPLPPSCSLLTLLCPHQMPPSESHSQNPSHSCRQAGLQVAGGTEHLGHSHRAVYPCLPPCSGTVPPGSHPCPGLLLSLPSPPRTFTQASPCQCPIRVLSAPPSTSGLTPPKASSRDAPSA